MDKQGRDHQVRKLLLVKCARAQQGLDLDILAAEPELASGEGDLILCRANFARLLSLAF